MTSADRRPQPSQPGERSDMSPNPAGDEKKITPELLEQVVAETIAAGVVPASREEQEAFLGVARRHRGRPLEYGPVVCDLVLVVLHLRLPRLDLAAAEWQEMATAVAQTLLEAPDTRAHLQSFWERLGQALV